MECCWDHCSGVCSVRMSSVRMFSVMMSSVSVVRFFLLCFLPTGPVPRPSPRLLIPPFPSVTYFCCPTVLPVCRQSVPSNSSLPSSSYGCGSIPRCRLSSLRRSCDRGIPSFARSRLIPPHAEMAGRLRYKACIRTLACCLPVLSSRKRTAEDRIADGP